MATSPLALKIISGLGGASVVGVGGYLCLNKKAEIDYLVTNLQDLNEKFDGLKIDGCSFTSAKSSCNGLDTTKLKKIFENFTNKSNISTQQNDATADLKIERIGEQGDGWKFIFTSNKDLTFQMEKDNDPIILKKGVKSEFKTTGRENKYLLQEILSSEVLSKIEGLPDECKNSTNSSCNLDKTKLIALKFIDDKDEKLDGNLNTEETSTGNIVSLTWNKSTSAPNYFSSTFEFTIKSIVDQKEVKIKKDSTDKISIPNSGIKLWLKKKTDNSVDKYYLSQELSEAGKESKVSLTCDSGNSCCQKSGESISGITIGVGETLTITKTTGTPPTYSVSSSGSTGSNNAGTYRIVYEEDRWIFKKEVAAV